MGLLTVTTEAAHFRLATAEAVRAELELDVADLPRLEQLLDQASSEIAAACNRVFARETVSETFRLASERRSLLLSRLPVFGDFTVTEDGTALTVATDCELDRDAGMLYRLSGDERTTWTATKVVVAYTGGFALPDAANRTLPPALERGAIDFVKILWFAAGRDPLQRSVQADGLGGETFALPGAGMDTLEGLPAVVANHVLKFRIPALA